MSAVALHAERGGQVKLVGVELDYAERGPADGTPLLLIMGLGMQRIAWPDSLLDALAERGMRCITFDNRDVGLSTRYDAYGVPSLPRSLLARLLRRRLPLPYRLADLADDAAGLLHHLQIPRAHILGMSMGGMIAQHFVHRHPSRTASLCLMSTSSGRLGLPLPTRAVLRQLGRRPRGRVVPEAAVRYMVEMLKLIGSPGFATDAETLEARCRAAASRATSGDGVLRQFAAIINDGDRSELLRHLKAPTLILHGSADPMVPMAHADDLQRKIPAARVERIDGWGHDLPDRLSMRLADHVSEHAHAAR